LRGVVAFSAAGAFLCWSLMNALGVFGAPTAPAKGAAAAAYQYDFLIKVTGSGSIGAPNGKVSFDISAKNDSGVTTGSCTVNEPKSKIKIKCIDVTSLTYATPAEGPIAVINGTATFNDTVVAYRIVVHDGGNPGVGNDTFSITTSNGYDRSGVLTDGNLTIQVQGL
jgi:hypothetical protein